MRPMRLRPFKKEDLSIDDGCYHFVLTGWKGNYNIGHERYFKIPYSSHSNYKELQAFVKWCKPHKLSFNLRSSIHNNDAALSFMCKLHSYTKTGE